MQEMWVRSLGWEDPLEKEMTTHSSILTWEISPNDLNKWTLFVSFPFLSYIVILDLEDSVYQYPYRSYILEYIILKLYREYLFIWLY